jgi:hypothetical protein
MAAILAILGVWFASNLAIFAFILWQRSPHFRQRVFRLTFGAFVPGERKQSYVQRRPQASGPRPSPTGPDQTSQARR